MKENALKTVLACLIACFISTLSVNAASDDAPSFQSADQDGNGEISRSEAQKSGSSTLARYFSAIDRNGNGRVDSTEYSQLSKVASEREKKKDSDKKDSSSKKKKKKK